MLAKSPAKPSVAKTSTAAVTHQVLIIGAGFAGLGCAIRLRQSGIDDVVILERDAVVGGTWRDNQYPGAACDIPSNLYSFSFAPNPNWSRSYSGCHEILAYTNSLLDRYALRGLIRFRQNVCALAFDDATGCWNVSTEAGEVHRARSVIMASGPLSNASFPKMSGIESFKGHKILSARWDHSYDFTGKRVAVIGTGATAIQIVPELVKQAAFVKVFQRTPGWMMPRFDIAIPGWAQRLFKRAPGTQRAVRQALYYIHEFMATGLIWNTPVTRVLQMIAKMHLRHQVKDSWLRRQLTPDFRIGCKRVLMSSDFYPALQQPNCKLITWPIACISPRGIRSVEGVEHVVDCIVFATGYDIYNSAAPYQITGRNGRQLAAEWAGGAQAYKSINVAGYPNLYITFGPNSGPGHNSALAYVESQIDYIVQGIKTVQTRGLSYVEVRENVQLEYNRGIQKRLSRTNWNSGYKSWYLTADGFNAAMYPGFATQFAHQLKKFDVKDYELVRLKTEVTAPA